MARRTVANCSRVHQAPTGAARVSASTARPGRGFCMCPGQAEPLHPIAAPCSGVLAVSSGLMGCCVRDSRSGAALLGQVVMGTVGVGCGGGGDLPRSTRADRPRSRAGGALRNGVGWRPCDGARCAGPSCPGSRRRAGPGSIARLGAARRRIELVGAVRRVLRGRRIFELVQLGLWLALGATRPTACLD